MYTKLLQDKGRGSIVMLEFCLRNRPANTVLHTWQRSGINLKVC